MLSLKCSERFLLSLLPGLNWSNNKSLLPKYKILEPAYMYAAISVKLVIQVKLFTRKENMISTSIVYFIYLSGSFLYKFQFDLMFTWLITWINIFSIRVFLHRHWGFTRHQKKRQTIFILLYHFHLLTKIYILTCNFACQMITTYF